MAIEQTWYVPVAFVSYVVTELSSKITPLTQYIKDETDSFISWIDTNVTMARGNVGESFLNGNGLMELNTSMRRIEDLFKDRFPGFVFKVDVQINEESYRVTCVTVSGKSLISEGELK